MQTLLILIFVIGYLAIAFEHPIKINKTATALLTGVLCWTVYIVFENNPDLVLGELSHHLASVSEILFFLLGAMTIVELIDAHDGFKLITDRITSRNTVKLLWLICLITFFLSALLDNLTTAIVMVSILRKLIKNEESRKFFAGVVIIAANAGGAWSPLGDVTTTMLWIGGQIS
jgi:Na+/H+ antiporter NhaD/arsenite permease-like protein